MGDMLMTAIWTPSRDIFIPKVRRKASEWVKMATGILTGTTGRKTGTTGIYTYGSGGCSCCGPATCTGGGSYLTFTFSGLPSSASYTCSEGSSSSVLYTFASNPYMPTSFSIAGAVGSNGTGDQINIPGSGYSLSTTSGSSTCGGSSGSYLSNYLVSGTDWIVQLQYENMILFNYYGPISAGTFNNQPGNQPAPNCQYQSYWTGNSVLTVTNGYPTVAVASLPAQIVLSGGPSARSVVDNTCTGSPCTSNANFDTSNPSYFSFPITLNRTTTQICSNNTEYAISVQYTSSSSLSSGYMTLQWGAIAQASAGISYMFSHFIISFTEPLTYTDCSGTVGVTTVGAFNYISPTLLGTYYPTSNYYGNTITAVAA